ncbi:Serine/threonine-protein kinase rio2 [Dispira simplex]|nr:Serine/threonine-protein kinase rio2 [Dispira simplex]
MKLDVKLLRYLSAEDFRVLTAVEMGSKNHQVVPLPIIVQIANLRHGGVQKCIAELARRNLVAKVINTKYEGYRLTYGGYDYLALKTLSKRGSVVSVGNQIGVGKESDIYVVADAEGNQRVLKIHRLGRTSFRTVKNNRDYMQGRKSASWLYMSRLSALKEMAFMKVLKDHQFPVPSPVDQNRHCVVMELVDAFPLRQIREVGNPGRLYSELMNMIVRLAQYGLIHGDFNEFNILIKEPGIPILIDFPQMVSTSHANAEYYFNRDVECIRVYFRRRFHYESTLYPRFTTDANREFNLDVQVAASGFNRKQQKDLEEYLDEHGRGDQHSDDDIDADDSYDVTDLSDSENEGHGGNDRMNESEGEVEVIGKASTLTDVSALNTTTTKLENLTL